MVVLGEARTPVRCSVGQFKKLEVEGAVEGVGRQGTQTGSSGTPDVLSAAAASSQFYHAGTAVRLFDDRLRDVASANLADGLVT